MRKNLQDFKGQVFGLLTVTGEADRCDKIGNKYRRVYVECACGKLKIVKLINLKTGCTRSCGCLRADVARSRSTKHNCSDGGENYNYLYTTWQGIKGRCLRVRNSNYHNYGGRGITIYQPWSDSFGVFQDWILSNLGERPKGHSLDRINNNGNYEPGNLRWADRLTQANNKTR